jgi:hypothetical protein
MTEPVGRPGWATFRFRAVGHIVTAAAVAGSGTSLAQNNTTTLNADGVDPLAELGV